MNDAGVVSVTGSPIHIFNPSVLTSKTDFLPRPKKDPIDSHRAPKPLLQWLVRRVECIRGRLPILMQCAPAFHYGMHDHTTTIVDDESVPIAIPHGTQQKKAVFESESLTLDLRYVVENTGTATTEGGITLPDVSLDFLDLSSKGHRGLAVQSLVELTEGQCITFILRIPPPPEVVAAQASVINPRRASDDPFLTKELVGSILHVRILCMLLPPIMLTPSRARMGTGTTGLARIHTLAPGRRLCYGVLSLSSSWYTSQRVGHLSVTTQSYLPLNRCCGCQSDFQSSRVHRRCEKLVYPYHVNEYSHLHDLFSGIIGMW